MQLIGHIYQGAKAVTPSDTVNQQGRSLFVGGAGNVAMVTVGGDVLTFTGVTANSIIPVEFTRINATNTTATALLALQ